MTRGFSPGQNQQGDLFAESLFDSVIYVTFQELATRVSHRNTGKACNETIADQLLQRVSADENLHMIFYRDVSEAGFDIAPNQAMRVAAPRAGQLQDARLHGARVPSQGRRHRRRRRLRPAHPPRRRGDAGAEEVAHLRARRLHRRGRAHARRAGHARRGTRGDLREVRDRQAAHASSAARRWPRRRPPRIFWWRHQRPSRTLRVRGTADRAHRAAQSGRAGPDGGRDERRIPHAVP